MDKGKLIPLLLAAALFIVAICLFINDQKNNKKYDKLSVSYKSQKNEYADLKVDDVIVVKNISFWIVSTVNDSIVIRSSGYLTDGGKEDVEFKIELNKSKQLCFKPDDCIIFSLL